MIMQYNNTIGNSNNDNIVIIIILIMIVVIKYKLIINVYTVSSTKYPRGGYVTAVKGRINY